MQLHTEKIATYHWKLYHGDQYVGAVISTSVNWVGRSWNAYIDRAYSSMNIDGDSYYRLLYAAYKIRRQIQQACGNRKKDVIFRVDVDQDTPIETIKKRVFTLQMAAR